MWNTQPGHGRERNLGHHRRGKQRIDRGSRERTSGRREGGECRSEGPEEGERKGGERERRRYSDVIAGYKGCGW